MCACMQDALIRQACREILLLVEQCSPHFNSTDGALAFIVHRAAMSRHDRARQARRRLGSCQRSGIISKFYSTSRNGRLPDVYCDFRYYIAVVV